MQTGHARSSHRKKSRHGVRFALQLFGAISLATLALVITTFTVLGYDTTSNVVSFDFTPKVMSTTQSAQTITFTAHFTGTNGTSNITVPTQAVFNSPSGATQLVVLFQPNNLVSGSPNDGTYVSTLIVPKNSEDGTWYLDPLSIHDNSNHTNTFRQSDMNALGVSTTFQVKNTRVIFLPLILRSGH